MNFNIYDNAKDNFCSFLQRGSEMPPNCKIVNLTSDSSDWIGHLLLENNQKLVGRSCLWNIVTKYYKASVQLDFVDCDEVLEAASGESNNFTETEAVIFNCSNTKFCLGKEWRK